MIQIRLLQVFLWFMRICLVFGIWAGLRDRAYIPTVIGVSVNAMWQYATMISIERRKQRLLQESDR